MTASSSLHLGNKVLCCELAVIAAIQEVDNKSQSQPPKEAQPGDDQQSSHERHAEHHGDNGKERHQWHLEPTPSLWLGAPQEKNAQRHQDKREKCANVRQIRCLADTEQPRRNANGSACNPSGPVRSLELRMHGGKQLR